MSRLQSVNWLRALPPGAAVVAVVMTLIALSKPIVAVGTLIAVAGLFLTWKRPDIVLMLIVAAAPFQNDLGGTDRDLVGGSSAGVAFSAAELLFAGALPAFLLNSLVQRRRLVLGPITIPVLLYFSICLVSSILNWRGPSTVISLGQILLYMVLAAMAYASFPKRLLDLKLALNALVYVGVFLAILSVSGLISVFNLNKNGAGASLASALLVCTELLYHARTHKERVRLGWSLAALTAGLVFSLSRGAWLGAIVGLVVILSMRRQFVLLFRAGIILALLTAVAWQFLPTEKKEYAFDFSEKRYNMYLRYKSIDIARDCFNQSPIFGVGVGLRKQVDATNVFWFTLAETGIVGLITFALIHAVFLWMVWTAHRRVDRSDFRFSLLVLGGALVISKLTHGMVDHYWSRGHLLVAWASAGMATGVYYSVRAQTKAASVPE